MKKIIRNKTQQQDYEANIFALCLLIPRELLIQELDRIGEVDLGGSDDVKFKELCKTFGVTTSAMAIRLNILNKNK